MLAVLLALAPALAAEGTSWMAPDRISVDVKGTLDYYYVAGEAGMQPGDRVRIEDPILHGMRWSKWAVDQLRSDGCSVKSPIGYSVSLLSALSNGPAAFELSRSTTAPEIHEYAWTEVTLTTGSLAPGQWVRVRYGDASKDPDCGHQTPDRAYQNVPWRAYEWLDGQATWQPLEPAPTFSLDHLPDVALLSVAAPSVVGVGEPFELTIGVLDELGNPMIDWEGPATIAAGEATGGAAINVPVPHGVGAVTWTTQLDTPGIARIPVSVDGVTALSNPIEVTAEPPADRLYWGDLHTHHGHSYVDESGARIDENHVYARDVMGMDVGCESMKAHPIEINGDTLWDEMQANCREYTSDGDYVAMLGVEWMSTDDGHHNLYFDGCEVPFSSHEQMVRLAGRGSTFAWMDALFAETGVSSVAVPHASMYTGHNWTDVDDARRTVAEIYSGWGSSMEQNGRPGSIQEALSGGNRVGFLGASDNHKGWMGNLVSIRRFQPGLGAFWAPELTRTALFESLEQRRTYATTGPRILLRFWAEDGDDRFEPGQDFRPSAAGPTFSWAAHGTEAIERVILHAVAEDGRVDVQSLSAVTPDDWDAEGSFTWEAIPTGDHAVWVEVVQVDGNRAWSTPIWVNNRGCGGCALSAGGPGETGGAGGALPVALLLPLILLGYRKR